MTVSSDKMILITTFSTLIDSKSNSRWLVNNIDERRNLLEATQALSRWAILIYR
jgi:hypothetical protein